MRKIFLVALVLAGGCRAGVHYTDTTDPGEVGQINGRQVYVLNHDGARCYYAAGLGLSCFQVRQFE